MKSIALYTFIACFLPCLVVSYIPLAKVHVISTRNPLQSKFSLSAAGQHRLFGNKTARERRKKEKEVVSKGNSDDSDDDADLKLDNEFEKKVWQSLVKLQKQGVFDEDDDDDSDNSDNDSDNDDEDGGILGMKLSSNELSLMNEETILDGVVRIFTTHTEPKFDLPWQRSKQSFSTSSGFAISGRKILTNAHAVEYGSMIQVKKRDSEVRYQAVCTAIGHQCDLAILEILDAETFWANNSMPMLSFGNIPQLLEDVSVVGYPVGGDSLSITSGVVSRIELQEYAQASANLLAIQIDAAINPGNSGGPVFNDKNQVIGVAFQSLSSEDTENIGYVVPVNVIQHFLSTAEKNMQKYGLAAYTVPSLGVSYQTLESKAMRDYLGLSTKDSGLRIFKIAPLSPANQVLQVDDVILSVDGIKIANDGTIPFRQSAMKERVYVAYYYTQKYDGDIVRLEILRKGQKQFVDVALWTSNRLIPQGLLHLSAFDNNHRNEKINLALGMNPSYLIVGGLVFIKATHEYLRQAFDVDDMSDFELYSTEFQLLALAAQSKSKPDEEVILLSQILSHSCNAGYESFDHVKIVKCNGHEIKNLKDLKRITDEALQEQLVDGGKARQISFEFASLEKIILNVDEVIAAQKQICQEHYIPSTCSNDLIPQ